jgi:hypothetical protein
MRFIANRIWIVGKLFLYSSILLLPIVAIAAHWFVTKNLAEPFHLGMMEWDLCTDIIGMATLGELAATGLILILLATFFRTFDWLRIKISN